MSNSKETSVTLEGGETLKAQTIYTFSEIHGNSTKRSV